MTRRQCEGARWYEGARWPCKMAQGCETGARVHVLDLQWAITVHDVCDMDQEVACICSIGQCVRVNLSVFGCKDWGVIRGGLTVLGKH